MNCLVTVTAIEDGLWEHRSECGRKFKLPTDVAIDMQCPREACYEDSPYRKTPIGVGTAIARLFHRLGLSSCLQCSRRANLMNGWGPDGCRERRAEIVGWLREAYRKTPKLKRAEALALAVSTGLVCRLRPWRLFDSLLDEAIRLADGAASA